jgi:nucleotide-binding universal stress UspA family protein
MYKRILVPLDGSQLAEAALEHARGLAQRFQAKVTLLRVLVSPYAVVAPDMVLTGYDANLNELSIQAQQYLKRMAARVEEAEVHVTTVVCEGPVAEAILEHAVALDVDLIIMSTHGRGGVSRWVYGSIADRILQAASCPVLVIRSKKTGM